MQTELTQHHSGLASSKVAELRDRYGENSLPAQQTQSLLSKFLSQFRNPLVYILLVALLVDSGIWIYEGATEFPLESLTILVILLANASLGLWQNLKSEIALARLDKLTEPHCSVFRDGRLQRVESRSLVPGDIVRVEAGERLPADGTVLQLSGFIVDESIITGESEPVAKSVSDTVLSGTMAARGAAIIEVTMTGPNSNMGRLAAMLAGLERDQTPLEKRLVVIGRRLALLISITALLLWLLGVYLTGLNHLGELFVFVVALTVAAVPESLPAVITFTLALGVERMARRKAVVRKLSAVEALGSVTTIATDKTGTLTENRMTVRELDVSDLALSYRAMALVNDADLDAGVGDPLELGILAYVNEQDPSLIASVREAFTVVSSRPFDAQWKYMRVSVRSADAETFSYFKGAPEVLLSLSTLSDSEQTDWQRRINEFAGKGYRALGLAHGKGEDEDQLQWLGLILLFDPPRPEVADSIAQARAAGIRVIMITGDHPATGAEIARQVGIEEGRCLSSRELESMSEEEFEQALADTQVFARVSPEMKLRIVESLQSRDEVVAVTGDGINDAPALKAADVGVAMGQRGSDVSREVADLVLLDDNFASIVAAIEEGRNTFENIQKIIRFLFAANLAEVLLIIIGSLVTFLALSSEAGIILPLTAAQILWINMLTDSVPALAITLDRSEGVLQLKPRAPSAKLLDRNNLLFILVIGITGSGLALAALFLLPTLGYDHSATQTLVFCYLTIVQLAFVNPARQSNLQARPNPLVSWALLVTLALQILVLTVPFLRGLLGLSALPWGLVGMLLGMLFLSWSVATVCSRRLRRSLT